MRMHSHHWPVPHRHARIQTKIHTKPLERQHRNLALKYSLYLLEHCVRPNKYSTHLQPLFGRLSMSFIVFFSFFEKFTQNRIQVMRTSSIFRSSETRWHHFGGGSDKWLMTLEWTVANCFIWRITRNELNAKCPSMIHRWWNSQKKIDDDAASRHRHRLV